MKDVTLPKRRNTLNRAQYDAALSKSDELAPLNRCHSINDLRKATNGRTVVKQPNGQPHPLLTIAMKPYNRNTVQSTTTQRRTKSYLMHGILMLLTLE